MTSQSRKLADTAKNISDRLTAVIACLNRLYDEGEISDFAMLAIRRATDEPDARRSKYQQLAITEMKRKGLVDYTETDVWQNFIREGE